MERGRPLHGLPGSGTGGTGRTDTDPKSHSPGISTPFRRSPSAGSSLRHSPRPAVETVQEAPLLSWGRLPGSTAPPERGSRRLCLVLRVLRRTFRRTRKNRGRPLLRHPADPPPRGSHDPDPADPGRVPEHPPGSVCQDVGSLCTLHPLPVPSYPVAGGIIVLIIRVVLSAAMTGGLWGYVYRTCQKEAAPNAADPTDSIKQQKQRKKTGGYER